MNEKSVHFLLIHNKQRNTEISAMTSVMTLWSVQWCAPCVIG